MCNLVIKVSFWPQHVCRLKNFKVQIDYRFLRAMSLPLSLLRIEITLTDFRLKCVIIISSKSEILENHCSVAIESANVTFYPCKIIKVTSGFNLKKKKISPGGANIYKTAEIFFKCK